MSTCTDSTACFSHGSLLTRVSLDFVQYFGLYADKSDILAVSLPPPRPRKLNKDPLKSFFWGQGLERQVSDCLLPGGSVGRGPALLLASRPLVRAETRP